MNSEGWPLLLFDSFAQLMKPDGLRASRKKIQGQTRSRSSWRDLRHHGGQVDGRARVPVSQLEHQLLFFLRKLLVGRYLPLQRHLQVLLLLR